MNDSAPEGTRDRETGDLVERAFHAYQLALAAQREQRSRKYPRPQPPEHALPEHTPKSGK